VKSVRLIISSLAAAALTATSGCAPAYQHASTQAFDVHSVNWGDIAIPGQMCKVSGNIQLHDGTARVSHSGLGPLIVQLFGTGTPGFLARGFPVTALNIFCNNLSGTAEGQLADGIFVFADAQIRFLGLLTPQYQEPLEPHVPLIAVKHISIQGYITTAETYYTSRNIDCCAITIWKWTGRTFIPGRTRL
jgi:hypothetical protein